LFLAPQFSAVGTISNLSNKVNFRMGEAPCLISIDPTAIPEGASSFHITITGVNFDLPYDTRQVRILKSGTGEFVMEGHVTTWSGNMIVIDVNPVPEPGFYYLRVRRTKDGVDYDSLPKPLQVE